MEFEFVWDMAQGPIDDDPQDLAVAYAVIQRERALQLEEALRHGRAVVDAMEYCHICKGQLVIDEGPHRCEDCSADCEDHGEPDCIPFDVLFEEFKRILTILEGK